MSPRTRLILVLCMCLGGAVFVVSLADVIAQPGGGKKGGKVESVDDFVAKLMAFNKKKDGKLTKEELIDTRLHSLFERADANKDGVLTREELEVLYQRENVLDAGKGDKGKGDMGVGDKGKGDKGKDGFGDKVKGDKGKDGKGKGPFGGGGTFGPIRPGQVLPPFFQEALNLTDEQRKQLGDLQKDVDAKLEKILSEDQRTRLRDMSAPKGFGDKKGPFGDKKGPPPADKKGPPDGGK